MKRTGVAIIVFTVLFLSGCGLTNHKRDFVGEHLKKSETAIISHDCQEAAKNIDYAINYATEDSKEDEKIQKLFSNQAIKDCYFQYLEKIVNYTVSIDTAHSTNTLLNRVKAIDVFPYDKIKQLFTTLNKKVVDGNKSGNIQYLLGDNIDEFPELKSIENQKYMVDRTIKAIQDKPKYRDIELGGIIQYVKKIGRDSPDGKKIESALPTMHLRGSELGIIADVFPEFAAKMKEQLTLNVYLQLINIDALSQEDITNAIKNKIKGINLISSPDKKSIAIKIERIRNNERSIPEQIQTISYTQTQVNLAAAVLLMPRGATYMYELISGGYSIEYGFTISAILDMKERYKNNIRGEVKDEYRYCQGSRIQNVFGGVTPADFIANEDMQLKCSQSSRSVSLDNLRNGVFQVVASELLNIPEIKKVHEDYQ